MKKPLNKVIDELKMRNFLIRTGKITLEHYKRLLNNLPGVGSGYCLYYYLPEWSWFRPFWNSEGNEEIKHVRDNLLLPQARLIHDIKSMKDNSIKKTINILSENEDLKRIFKNRPFTICVVPPHKLLKKSSGIKLVAEGLCKSGRLDGTDCLVRKHDVIERKKIYSGVQKEDKEGLKKSLAVEKKHLIKGRYILLMDDISTSGDSLISAKEILMGEGAKGVVSLVLGCTINVMYNG
jgi:hypothetical protein